MAINCLNRIFSNHYGLKKTVRHYAGKDDEAEWMETVVEIMMGFIWWIIGFPIICLAATPFILLVSCRGTGPYLRRVCKRYRGLVEFWKENGILLVP